MNNLPKRQLILLFGDILLIIASFYLSSLIRWGELLKIPFSSAGPAVFSLLSYFLAFYVADLYNLEEKFKSEKYVIRFASAVIIASCFIAVVFYMFPFLKYGRGILFLNAILVFILSIAWHFAFDMFFRYKKTSVNVLIIGAGQTGKTLLSAMNGKYDFEVVGVLDDDINKWGMTIGSSSVIGGTELLSSLAKEKKISKVVVAITHDTTPELIKSIVAAKFSGIEIYDMPTIYENITGKIPVLHINDRWFGYADVYGIKRNLYNTKIKKLLDMSIAVLGVILLMPIMLVTALLIKLESNGPVFYRQERVGRDEKVFTLFKFRSMNVDAEMNGPVWARENDDRLTKVGRIIRLLRVDEIPQLWNVLKGEMSFIGPRPERPEFVNTLNHEIPYYSLRHSVKPGITGWAQVNYRYGASKEDALEKLHYDLFYIKNASFLLDSLTILKTIRVVLFGKGAR